MSGARVPKGLAAAQRPQKPAGTPLVSWKRRKRDSRKESEKLQIDREVVATIRQRLSEIRKAAKGTRKIIDALDEIEKLLPD